MKMQHLVLAAGILGGGSSFGATAPDSISNSVYFETSNVTATFTERTIIFRGDGSYTFLKLAVSPPDSRQVVISSPPPDGTYLYTRTSDTDATFVLNATDGSTVSKFLRFITSDFGSFSDRPSAGTNFQFAPLGITRAKPVQNISLRATVAPSRPVICGFVIPRSAGTQEVMIRVVGPSLTQFGVSSIWADPDFVLFAGPTPAEPLERHLDDWESLGSGNGLRKIFNYVGAFGLAAASKDAVDVVRLQPGDYSVVCTPKLGDAGGDVLIEVYFIP